MSSNIEYVITPIEDAVDAILESIRENFLKDLDDKFIPTQLEVDLGKYIEEFKDELYCVIEYPYVDKVYRDSYYNYYSSKHYSYQRDCIRVSLFDSKIKQNDFLNPGSHRKLNSKYLGFFIIRPTINAPFGRSIINPKAIENDSFKICTCKVNNLVFGAKLETVGFPHSSQDSETLKCAETTIWALMEYFGHKYPEYKPTLPTKIHKALERFSFQRQLPSSGLTMDEISFALKEFGFGTKVYSSEPYDVNIYKIIDSYVESGIPVILGLQSGHIGHAIIAIGKKYEEINNWKLIKQSTLLLGGKKVKYYDTYYLPGKYVVQDDNQVPYRLITLDKPGEHYEEIDCQNYLIDSVVVPLYPKVYLETVVAKELAIQIINDDNLGFKFKNNFVLRFYLTSSRSFKNHITCLPKMDKVLKNNILLTKMPKFVWCSEFYLKESYQQPDKQAIGLVILDATEANKESIDAFIFAGYPDRCISMNENNFVSLPLAFENYSYFSNLK